MGNVKLKLKDKNRVFIESSDYSKINLSNVNRKISQVQVRNLANSVMRNGILRLVLVIQDKETGNYVVVDGQHLAMALMELGMTIECQVIECESKQDFVQLMIDLNTTSKSWRISDYLHSWTESGNANYKTIKKILDKTKIQVSVLLSAYSQTNRTMATLNFKNGSFRIKNKGIGDKIVKDITSLHSILPNTRVFNECLVKLMLSYVDYNNKKMIKNLKAVSKTIQFSTGEKKLYNQLASIYNK